MLRPSEQGVMRLSRLPGRVFCAGSSDCSSVERVAAFAPSLQTALQRPNPLDAILPEEQRHTGAGSFVWSSAIENDFAVAWQTVILLLQIRGIHAKSAGNGMRVGLKVHRMPKIDDHQVLSRIDLRF